MNSTWYNVAVVVLWVAAMTWLVSQKMMPALLVGEPPSYRTIVEAQHDDPLVGWSMAWNDRPMGWALTKTLPLPNDMTDVRSLVHFDDLPLKDMISDTLLARIFPTEEWDIRLQLEAKSRLTFDPLHRLSQFESSVGLEGADPVKVRGTLDGPQMHFSIHAGNFTYDTDVPLPQNRLLTDGLTPQTELPGLRDGQNWNVEVFSPLRSPANPSEILQARVEGSKPVPWGGRVVKAWLVVYRSDPGSGTARAEHPRGKLWVLDDGTVVRQEVRLFDSKMTFRRLSSEEARALADAAGDWE
jgi:hypothetical protein